MARSKKERDPIPEHFKSLEEAAEFANSQLSGMQFCMLEDDNDPTGENLLPYCKTIDEIRLRLVEGLNAIYSNELSCHKEDIDKQKT